jgi:hypothetical protein
MSSETSTDVQTFRPWHLFVLAGLLASTVGVVVVRPSDPVVLVILVAAIASAAGVGFTLYRTLWPLGATDFQDKIQVIQGRTRAALEREKTLVLRAIKELEFDRAMSKVSDEDFQDMSQRLRSQALVLMRKLDVDGPGYREVIEQELAQRLGFELDAMSDGVTGLEDDELDRDAGDVSSDRPVCGGCGTANEADARFCKACGSALAVRS